MPTSVPICSLVYVSDQIKGFGMWYRQSRLLKKDSFSGDTRSEGFSIFKRLSKGIFIIQVDDFFLFKNLWKVRLIILVVSTFSCIST